MFLSKFTNQILFKSCKNYYCIKGDRFDKSELSADKYYITKDIKFINLLPWLEPSLEIYTRREMEAD